MSGERGFKPQYQQPQRNLIKRRPKVVVRKKIKLPFAQRGLGILDIVRNLHYAGNANEVYTKKQKALSAVLAKMRNKDYLGAIQLLRRNFGNKYDRACNQLFELALKSKNNEQVAKIYDFAGKHKEAKHYYYLAAHDVVSNFSSRVRNDKEGSGNMYNLQYFDKAYSLMYEATGNKRRAFEFTLQMFQNRDNKNIYVVRGRNQAKALYTKYRQLFSSKLDFYSTIFDEVPLDQVADTSALEDYLNVLNDQNNTQKGLTNDQKQRRSELLTILEKRTNEMANNLVKKDELENISYNYKQVLHQYDVLIANASTPEQKDNYRLKKLRFIEGITENIYKRLQYRITAHDLNSFRHFAFLFNKEAGKLILAKNNVHYYYSLKLASLVNFSGFTRLMGAVRNTKNWKTRSARSLAAAFDLLYKGLSGYVNGLPAPYRKDVVAALNQMDAAAKEANS